LPNLLDASKPYFPNAISFTTYVVPGAGHGLNLEYTHNLTYSTIFAYLTAQGLSAQAISTM
jgi:hypothetical protein